MQGRALFQKKATEISIAPITASVLIMPWITNGVPGIAPNVLSKAYKNLFTL
jgi:hypothetical protein